MTATPVWFDGESPHLATTRRTLPCGLDVVVHADASAAMACVSVWYRVGSSDERADLTGLAHLFEHLFKNSAHMPAKHYEVLRLAGATDANASTSADRTAYHEVVPAHQLELALWLESDRMGFFLAPGVAAGIADELGVRLATQQGVVRAERRQRYEDVPFGAERFAVAAALYPEGHPQRHLTIGRHADIAAATIDDVCSFYRTWYVPANATLVIAGDVGEPGEVDALVDRYFGSFPASQRPQRPCPRQPVIATPVVERVDDRFATLPRIHRAWHGPAMTAAGEAELDVLTSAWAQPGTGVLWRALVYDTSLAQRVSAWVASTRLGGEVHVTVDLRPGADPARVRAILDDVVARPIDDAAVQRAVTRREAGAIWALTAIARRAQLVQRFVLYRDDPDGLAAELDRYRAVTPAGIDRARETWLRARQMVEVETVPAATATS